MALDKAIAFVGKCLETSGCSCLQLKDAGFFASELKAGSFDLASLIAAGYNASQPKSAAFTANDVKVAGQTVREMRDNGWALSELKDAGFDVVMLLSGGCSASDLRSAGFTAAQMKDAGCSCLLCCAIARSKFQSL